MREEKLCGGLIIRKKEKLGLCSIFVLKTKFNMKVKNSVRAKVRESNLYGIFSYKIILISS